MNTNEDATTIGDAMGFLCLMILIYRAGADVNGCRSEERKWISSGTQSVGAGGGEKVRRMRGVQPRWKEVNLPYSG